MDLKQLYQDIILEHGKSPRNLGKCEGYNYNAKGEMGDGGNTTVIPTKNVIKKFKIEGLWV